jgi:prophage antirepressor-like protein
MLGRPIAEYLEYLRPSDAILKLNRSYIRKYDEFENDKNNFPTREIQFINSQNIISTSVFINQAGLFELMNKSTMPKAKEFQNWVNGDVLPKLTKNEVYNMYEAPIEQQQQIKSVNLLVNESKQLQQNQEQLKYSLFPLGKMSKQEVRKIAIEQNLPVATKKDSTGICFIGERDFRKFLTNYLPLKQGNIIDKKTGNLLGTHTGVFYYTIGQRKGLGIGGIANHVEGSWSVVAKDIDKNILYVVQGDDPMLYGEEVNVTDVNWISRTKPTGWINCFAKFRYREGDNPVSIKFVNKDKIIVKCNPKFKAITPGQIAVFYDGLNCLGGGIIDEVK